MKTAQKKIPGQARDLQINFKDEVSFSDIINPPYKIDFLC